MRKFLFCRLEHSLLSCCAATLFLISTIFVIWSAFILVTQLVTWLNVGVWQSYALRELFKDVGLSVPSLPAFVGRIFDLPGLGLLIIAAFLFGAWYQMVLGYLANVRRNIEAYKHAVLVSRQAEL